MTGALQFVDASAVEPAAWDRVVDESPDGWVFALSGWQRLIVAVKEWGLSDRSFAAYRDGALAAVVPLQFQASSKRLGSTGWGLAGPVLASGLDEGGRTEVLRDVLARVDEIAAGTGASSIDMGRSPVTRSAHGDPGAPNPFVAFGYADCSTQTRIIDLQAGDDALWLGLSKNARQMVKKAEGLGYRVTRGDWPALADEYYRVHCETYQRTGVPPHPRGYFDGIARETAPRGNAVLWAGHAPDGRVVAFHNDARLGPGALYHTGCSETAHLDSGINYLLMWEAIRGARRDGCRWYEVGEVFPDAADGKSRGLTVFKSKFGGGLRPSFKARRVLEAPVGEAPEAEAERRLRQAYRESSTYAPSRVSHSIDAGADDYADRSLRDRFAMIEECYHGGRIVDLCCATGAHLLDLGGRVDAAVGIDFAARYLEDARAAVRERGLTHVTFAQADVRALPLSSGSVDLVYCLSSLYAIPRAEEVIAEVGRVLKPGGQAVLDFGNRRSINAYCLRSYPEWPFHPLTLGAIRRAVASAGLQIVRHRAFQILPLWTDRPAWLRPLLHPAWKRLMKCRLRGRMLDEWISSLPLVRAFAFRHVLVCRKP